MQASHCAEVDPRWTRDICPFGSPFGKSLACQRKFEKELLKVRICVSIGDQFQDSVTPPSPVQTEVNLIYLAGDLMPKLASLEVGKAWGLSGCLFIVCYVSIV